MKTITELLNELFDAIEVAKKSLTNLPLQEDPEVLRIREQIEALFNSNSH